MAGVPSTFIRLAGCPLRCKWCDTKYGWDQTAGIHFSIEKIIQTAGQYQSKFVVITGGEPMINPDMSVKSELPELVRKLKACDKHITIETVGIAFVPDMPCDLMSISPKLRNSTPDDPELAAVHEDSRLDIAVLRELIEHYKYQLKFVVDSQNDLQEIKQRVEEIGNVDSEKVMLMPQAVSREELLSKSPMVADLCKKSGYAFCQRLQVLFWDNEKGT